MAQHTVTNYPQRFAALADRAAELFAELNEIEAAGDRLVNELRALYPEHGSGDEIYDIAMLYGFGRLVSALDDCRDLGW